MKKRFIHAVIINCSLRDIYEHEDNGWEICGVNGNTQYPNPIIYFKKPHEETDQKSSEQS